MENFSWLHYSQALALALGLMTAVWLLSLRKSDASIVDIVWGAGFALLAWFYFFSASGATTRKALVPILVTVWGLRLSLHILVRNAGRGEDYRYAAIREANPEGFPVRSLATVFWLQGGLIWAISAPLAVSIGSTNRLDLNLLDWIGLALFTIGLFFETVSDWQLARFRADPANAGSVLDRGLWRYSRHPNYFGDAMVWWGFFCLAAAAGGWWTIYSPLVMTFLLIRVSGVKLLERSLIDSKPAYREYVRRTSTFLPWFPRP